MSVMTVKFNGRDIKFLGGKEMKELFERRHKMKVKEELETALSNWKTSSTAFDWDPVSSFNSSSYSRDLLWEPSYKKPKKKSPKKKKPYFDRNCLKVTDFYCNNVMTLAIKQVVFNDPATIVLWKDGSKTVVKCKDGDIFDREVGLAMCFMKKIFGKEFHHVLKTYARSDEPLNSLTPQKAD